MTAAKRLRQWRGKRTQQEVAELLGVEQGRLSKLEAGKRVPGLALALKIQALTGGLIPASAWTAPSARTGTEG